MAVGVNGAIGLNALTPERAPRETAVPAANDNATDRHPRTEDKNVWDIITK